MLFAYILFGILIGLAVAQGILVLGFVLVMRSKSAEARPDELLVDADCPKAAVILCLRGGDPFLDNCLRALFQMDYPNYEVHIIVDHPDDPAWQTVNAITDELQPNNLHKHTLEKPRETCSLKCSSIVQVVSGLDDAVEFVAQLDADTIPHKSWLRELATPLADESIGAATGNRWYMPDDASWGSLIRYFWNSAAIVQMFWYKIAWGGTLAVKTKVFRESELLDRWGNAFCEDTMTYRMLKPMGLRLAFVPSLLMVNRESCDTGGYFRWVRRQLLTARLYHPNWFLVVLHGMNTTLTNLVAMIFLIVALVQQQTEAAIWTATGIGAFQACNYLFLTVLEFAARHPIKSRGESTSWILGASANGLVKLCKMFIAVALTQIVYFVALCSCLKLRVVDWRGVTYKVDGPWKIRLEEYRPYQSEQSADDLTSL